MKKMQLLTAVSAAALCAGMLCTGVAQAQGPGGPGGPGGFGGGMARMRNSPKFRLGGLMRGVGSLEKDPKEALTSAQARAFVNAIVPWQKRQHMTDTDAKTLYMKLNGILTSRQKND